MDNFIKFLLKSLIFILSKFLLISAQDNNYGLCIDALCSAPVAEGVTTLTYNSPDVSRLSFGPNEPISIYVKDYGVKKDLFGVMLKGVRGYIPKAFIRETKSFGKAMVPAQTEFTSMFIDANMYHASSHIHVSQISSDVFASVQSSVPNNIDPQQSSQIIRNSDYLLQSSRQNEHSDSHASSDRYIVSDADSEDYNLHGSVSFHHSNVDHSSHIHFGSHNVDPSTLSSNGPNIISSNNFVQPSLSQNPSESQWQNPSSFASQQSILPNENIRSNLDFQSNVLHHTQKADSESIVSHSQNFDFQSNHLFHGQGSQIPQVTTDDQLIHLQTKFPIGSQINDENYDETVALLNKMGYNDVFPQMTTGDAISHLNLGVVPNVITHSDTANSVVPNTISHSDAANPAVSNIITHGDATNPVVPGDITKQNVFEHTSKQYVSPDLAQPFISGDTTKQTIVDDKGKQFSHEDTTTRHFTQGNADKILGNGEASNQYSSWLATKPLTADSSSEQFSHGTLIKQFPSENLKSQFTPPVPNFLPEGHTVEFGINQNKQFLNSNPNKLYKSNTVSYQDNPSTSSKESIQSSLDSSATKTSSNISSEYVKPKKVAEVEETTDSKIEDISAEEDYFDDEKEENYIDNQELANEVTSDSTSKEINETTIITMEAEQSIKNVDNMATVTENIQSISKQDASKELVNEPTTIISPLTTNDDDISSNVLLSTEMPQKTDEYSDQNISDDTQVDILVSKVDKNQDIEKNDLHNLITTELKENNTINKEDSIKPSEDDNLLNHEKLSQEGEVTADSFISVAEKSDLSTFVNSSDETEMKDKELANAYQSRHLNDVGNSDNVLPTEDADQTTAYSVFNIYNIFAALRSLIETLLLWMPDPIYSILIDLEKDGISPKATVFTALSAFPCVILIVLLVYVKEKSKEKILIAKLTVLDKNLYNARAEKSIVEEKLEKIEIEFQSSRSLLEEEKIFSFKLKTEIESLKQRLEETTIQFEKSIDEVDALKEREREYSELVRDHEKEHLNLLELKNDVESKLSDQEGIISNLTEQLQEKESEIEKLSAEKSECVQANGIYEEKMTQLQKNCNQLLQEAEVWNLRVQELNEKLSQETTSKQELEKLLNEKNIEVESLTQAVQIFKSFEAVGEADGEDHKSSEEKLKYLINSSYILLKLQKEEEENKLLSEKLAEEKNKLMDMEVSILDVKSEYDKLKLNYNQALQDKAEAQTKLEVLTNYFKDKEIQLQKQLGVQEAVRQKTEEDASSAERRICLIEQENASYKYQVATMKQEMEETERNLKSQIALQEKKAHENWLAARTAERKLEDSKQEIMQLRQRLTLLEREQENWSNAAREEIIRPVPKRVNANDDTITTQDSNSSVDLRPNRFPLLPPPPPMMLPPDRPLPPLPPLPPFMPPPPFEPPHFQTQPWNLPPGPLPNADYRMTPPDFGRGRESTPPRGRNSAVADGEMGPRQSSPITDIKDSRNSTPPHLLPDFHDIPPHPSRPYYPPMGPPSRFPPPRLLPNFRRDYNPGQRRLDSQDETNSHYSSQHSSVPPEDWHNPNSRV